MSSSSPAGGPRIRRDLDQMVGAMRRHATSRAGESGHAGFVRMTLGDGRRVIYSEANAGVTYGEE